MCSKRALAAWIKRGCQKQAVAAVLKKPMTASEILVAARPLNSQIQLRDIRIILRRFIEKGLVQCLTPDEMNGKTFCPTQLGREVLREAFGIDVPPLPEGIDWPRYAYVARGKTRKLVLRQLATPDRDGVPRPKTATQIKKALTEGGHPMGLNPTRRALKELVSVGLATSRWAEDKGGMRLYKTTPAGKGIAEWGKSGKGATDTALSCSINDH